MRVYDKDEIARIRERYGGANIDLAVVVLSCDKYNDLWKPFFYCFEKYWAECPFPIFLFSNEICFAYPGVTTVLSGPDSDWSSSVKSCVEQIANKYLLVLFDDVFLNSPIKSNDLYPFLSWLDNTKPEYLRIRPIPRPDERVSDDFGRFHEKTLYRTAVFSIWNRAVLLNLLEKGESAWDFETKGSARSTRYPGFYGSYRECPLRYIHGVEKGKWIPSAFEWVVGIGAPVCQGTRPLMSSKELLISRWAHFREFFFNNAPAQMRPLLLSVSRNLKRVLFKTFSGTIHR